MRLNHLNEPDLDSSFSILENHLLSFLESGWPSFPNVMPKLKFEFFLCQIAIELFLSIRDSFLVSSRHSDHSCREEYARIIVSRSEVFVGSICKPIIEIFAETENLSFERKKAEAISYSSIFVDSELAHFSHARVASPSFPQPSNDKARFLSELLSFGLLARHFSECEIASPHSS